MKHEHFLETPDGTLKINKKFRNVYCLLMLLLLFDAPAYHTNCANYGDHRLYVCFDKLKLIIVQASLKPSSPLLYPNNKKTLSLSLTHFYSYSISYAAQ